MIRRSLNPQENIVNSEEINFPKIQNNIEKYLWFPIKKFI